MRKNKSTDTYKNRSVMRKIKTTMGMGMIVIMLGGTLVGCSSTSKSTTGTTETTTTQEVSTNQDESADMTSSADAETTDSSGDSSSTYAMTEGEITVVKTDLVNDSSYDETTATKIQLTESGFEVSGEGVAGALAEENVLTITASGTYILTGTSADASIIVDSEESVQIVLNGVSLTSATNSAIYVKNAELTTITVAAGTENTISDSANYVFEDATEEEPDGAIYSKDDLVINGTGTLTVNGLYSHAIKANDQLLVAEATIITNSVKDSFTSNEELVIASGNLTITAGDDAIHSDLALSIDGGVINIISSEEGIEASAIAITGGDIIVNSNDDGLNAASDESTVNSISISGGTLQVNASGDGIDSNGFIVMTGGEVTVSGPTNDGNGFMDYDSSFTLNGGTIIASGSSGMAQSISDTSEQTALLVVFDQVQSAGTTVTLKNSSGDLIAEITPEKEFSAVLISNSQMQQGETYSVSTNDTELCTVTLDQVATAIKSDGTETTVGMMGGGMGGAMHQGFDGLEDGEMPSGERPTGERPDGAMPGDTTTDSSDSTTTTE